MFHIKILFILTCIKNMINAFYIYYKEILQLQVKVVVTAFHDYRSGGDSELLDLGGVRGARRSLPLQRCDCDISLTQKGVIIITSYNIQYIVFYFLNHEPPQNS